MSHSDSSLFTAVTASYPHTRSERVAIVFHWPFQDYCENVITPKPSSRCSWRRGHPPDPLDPFPYRKLLRTGVIGRWFFFKPEMKRNEKMKIKNSLQHAHYSYTGVAQVTAPSAPSRRCPYSSIGMWYGTKQAALIDRTHKAVPLRTSASLRRTLSTPQPTLPDNRTTVDVTRISGWAVGVWLLAAVRSSCTLKIVACIG